MGKCGNRTLRQEQNAETGNSPRSPAAGLFGLRAVENHAAKLPRDVVGTRCPALKILADATVSMTILRKAFPILASTKRGGHAPAAPAMFGLTSPPPSALGTAKRRPGLRTVREAGQCRHSRRRLRRSSTCRCRWCRCKRSRPIAGCQSYVEALKLAVKVPALVPSIQNCSAVLALGGAMCSSMQCHAFSESDGPFTAPQAPTSSITV